MSFNDKIAEGLMRKGGINRYESGPKPNLTPPAQGQGGKDMKTPREKYMNDVHYRALVDFMIASIQKCDYTPSEMREAVILACTLYEENNVRKPGYVFDNKMGRNVADESQKT